MYSRYAARNGLKTEVLHKDYGKASLSVMGSNAISLFKHEAGKHVIQRCPPTENKGRRHTSMVCVAVLPVIPDRDFTLTERDIEIKTKRGSGPGGQHRNKTESCVTIKHKPTGITATVDSRDQHANKRKALQILESRVHALLDGNRQQAVSSRKREQVDGGGRGNKVRTYNFINNRVTDHRLETKTSKIDKVMKGHLDLLW